MDGLLGEEEVGDDSGVPEDRDSELLDTHHRSVMHSIGIMKTVITVDGVQEVEGGETYRSDREAIRPVTLADIVDINEVLVPEGDCGGEEDDADQRKK